MRSGRTPNVQIVENSRLIRLSNGATGSRIVMTPPKGKFMIQRTGGQVKVMLEDVCVLSCVYIVMIFQMGYTTTTSTTSGPVIPPGVTVTPTPPIRQLAANNISVSFNI